MTSFVQPEGRTLPLFRRWEIRGGVHIDDVAFVAMLRRCVFFDAVTYTANASMLENCRRLITARIWGDASQTRTEIRIAANVHTKLYVLDDGEVWVSSMNLVEPGGWHNVSVRVGAEQAVSLRLYCDRLWSLAGLSNAKEDYDRHLEATMEQEDYDKDN